MTQDINVPWLFSRSFNKIYYIDLTVEQAFREMDEVAIYG